MAGKEKKHWVYHSGLDKFYLQSGFSEDNYTQAKGSILDWQCKNCEMLIKEANANAFFFLRNKIDGVALNVPQCSQCKKPLRLNVNMRNDLEWMEGDVGKQLEAMQTYFSRPDIKKRSITVIEIGAGPA
jgi:NAD-dependent SIR2 family protein deacetylase